jgi:hypothetical protein
MGLSNDIPSWALIIGGIGFLIHDAYHAARHKVSKAYDYLEDRLDTASTLLSSTADNLAYQTGLSPTSHIPRSFAHFQQLPGEIRVQIWQHALPGPRVVEIRAEAPEEATKRGRGGGRCGRVTSRCRVPTLLHVCREARGVALGRYTLTFGVSISGERRQPTISRIPLQPRRNPLHRSPVGHQNPRWAHIQMTEQELDRDQGLDLDQSSKVFVDFKRDIVYFDTKADHYIQKIPDRSRLESKITGLERIERLAFRYPGHGQPRGDRFGDFDSLKEIIMIPNRLKFGLGPEPTLVEVEGEAFSGDREWMLEILKAWYTEQKMPVVRMGRFVKGKGDTWYCEGRGRALFG